MKHPDPADQALDHQEKELAAALEAQRQAFPQSHYGRRPAPRGHCLNPDCLDDFEPGDQRLFCDAACADAHARLTRR